MHAMNGKSCVSTHSVVAIGGSRARLTAAVEGTHHGFEPVAPEASRQLGSRAHAACFNTHRLDNDQHLLLGERRASKALAALRCLGNADPESFDVRGSVSRCSVRGAQAFGCEFRYISHRSMCKGLLGYMHGLRDVFSGRRRHSRSDSDFVAGGRGLRRRAAKAGHGLFHPATEATRAVGCTREGTVKNGLLVVRCIFNQERPTP